MCARKLTIEEELDILNELKVFIGAGSGRAVFDYKDGMCVKIAVNTSGQTQNRFELDIFRNYGSEFVTEIYAYGQLILVVEKIQELDPDGYGVESICYALDSSTDDASNTWSLNYQKTIKQKYPAHYAQEIIDINDFLESVLTVSSDNYQIGIRADGTLACYDYGYNNDYHESIIGSNDYLVREHDPFKTLSIAIAALEFEDFLDIDCAENFYGYEDSSAY